MKRWSLVPVLALVLAASSGCIIVSDDEDSTLTIDNQSSFALQDIAVARPDDPEFGPNLLGNDLLLPGEAITIALDCGVYDVLVVDEDAVECELLGLDLCFEDAIFVITDGLLNSCAF